MAATTPNRGSAPDWDALFQVAQGQASYFTTRQAAFAGYSPQLLAYLVGKRVERVRRGIDRLIHFPASEHEDLIVLWPWAEQAGVFSHETALALHDLSDVLPGKVHMTVPLSWRRRRLRVPAGLVLHFADVGDVDRASDSAVPVTAPLRTLRDCIEANSRPTSCGKGSSRRVGARSPPRKTKLDFFPSLAAWVGRLPRDDRSSLLPGHQALDPTNHGAIS